MLVSVCHHSAVLVLVDFSFSHQSGQISSLLFMSITYKYESEYDIRYAALKKIYYVPVLVFAFYNL